VDTADGLVVLAGQAVYTIEEWAGTPDELEGRSGAPDQAAYDDSLDRLRELEPARVFFGHDRRSWSRAAR
jgi:glyoxylase-like metal-dependent hydrolase (beta-lactamase superfamily II)